MCYRALNVKSKCNRTIFLTGACCGSVNDFLRLKDAINLSFEEAYLLKISGGGNSISHCSLCRCLVILRFEYVCDVKNRKFSVYVIKRGHSASLPLDPLVIEV